VAVKLLVIDAMRNTVSGSTGAFDATSRRPVTPACASSPSMTMPQLAPGTCACSVNALKMRSISGNAAFSFARRPASANCGGGALKLASGTWAVTSAEKIAANNESTRQAMIRCIRDILLRVAPTTWHVRTHAEARRRRGKSTPNTDKHRSCHPARTRAEKTATRRVGARPPWPGLRPGAVSAHSAARSAARRTCERGGAFAPRRLGVRSSSPRDPYNVRSELTPRRRLLHTPTPGGDLRLEVVLAANGRAGKAAHHGKLADVREGVGHGTLEQAFSGAPERRIRAERGVEPRERIEESPDVGVPRLRLRLAPGVLAARERSPPVEQIAHVREDFARAPAAVGPFHGVARAE